MFSMIQYNNAAYPIAHIEGIELQGAVVKIGMSPSYHYAMYVSFPNENKAKAFYHECLEKIEAYYQAMRPPKLPETIENLDISIDKFNYVNRLPEKAGE